MDNHIPFNSPFVSGNELRYIQEAIDKRWLAGNGFFTQKCQDWLKNSVSCKAVLLTHSCTAALEMIGLLLKLQPGDEVIMPSFTFSSTANAFVLRGAVPVFVDIREDTLCIDERLIEAAITEKTKAIVVVHYAGVPCEMDTIMAIAKKHHLYVIEDAAQGIFSTYKGRPLGSIGHLAALSFQETKNIISGEGGALLINDEAFIERADYLWEKGTNRKQFVNGLVDKYTWVDVGSSFLPSEMIAAFLWAQLEQGEAINNRRLAIWKKYHSAFADLEAQGIIRRPFIPENCKHNGHIYYLLLQNKILRDQFIKKMNASNINATFHYIPLHSAIAGRKFGRADGDMNNTDDLSGRLVRLPLWIGVEPYLDRVIDSVNSQCLSENQGEVSANLSMST